MPRHRCPPPNAEAPSSASTLPPQQPRCRPCCCRVIATAAATLPFLSAQQLRCRLINHFAAVASLPQQHVAATTAKLLPLHPCYSSCNLRCHHSRHCCCHSSALPAPLLSRCQQSSRVAAIALPPQQLQRCRCIVATAAATLPLCCCHCSCNATVCCWHNSHVTTNHFPPLDNKCPPTTVMSTLKSFVCTVIVIVIAQ